MARQRLPAAQWAVLIDEWRQSGLDLPEFCRRRGLNRGTMQGWVYKSTLKRAIETARQAGRSQGGSSRETNGPSAPSPAFLPVRVTESVAPTAGPIDRAAIEIVLGARCRIIVGPGFDPQTLRQVVVALES